MGPEALVLPTLPDLPFIFPHLALHLHCLSYPLLYTKLVNVHNCVLEFCELFSQMNKTGRSCGNPRFVAKSDRSEGNLKTHYLQLVSEVGGQSGGNEPFTGGVYPKSRQLFPELLAVEHPFI